MADRNHAAAVARLGDQIARIAILREPAPNPPHVDTLLRAITSTDEEHAVWIHYTDTLQRDEDKRAAMPTKDEIAAEHRRAVQRIDAVEGGPVCQRVMIFNRSTDYERKAGARHFDETLRTRRMAALRAAMKTRDTRFIQPTVLRYATNRTLIVEPGSADRPDLCYEFTRAETAALNRSAHIIKDATFWHSAEDPEPIPIGVKQHPLPGRAFTPEMSREGRGFAANKRGSRRLGSAIV